MILYDEKTLIYLCRVFIYFFIVFVEASYSSYVLNSPITLYDFRILYNCVNIMNTRVQRAYTFRIKPKTQ